MRSKVKVALFIVVVIVGLFVCIWPTVEMELAGSAHYTEQDKKEYEYYTPDILKQIPRISGTYFFDFYKIDEQGARVYSVTFYNTQDTNKINARLTSLGYARQDNCSVEGDCWIASDPTERVTVSAVPEINAVIVKMDNTPQS